MTVTNREIEMSFTVQEGRMKRMERRRNHDQANIGIIDIVRPRPGSHTTP